jgi:2-octaprenylphenol hydroxylase
MARPLCSSRVASSCAAAADRRGRCPVADARTARLRTREWDYGHRAIVTTAPFERGHQSRPGSASCRPGPWPCCRCTVADDRLCSIVWSIDEDKADRCWRWTTTALLPRRLARPASTAWVRSRRLRGAPRLPLRQRHAIDYVLPGAALVGDAAHTIHPLAGQGINLGLADVEVLAEELARSLDRGLDPGRLDVLRRYQRRRKGDNLAMMAAMDGFKRLFEQDAPPLRWLRNSGMRGVARCPRSSGASFARPWACMSGPSPEAFVEFCFLRARIEPVRKTRACPARHPFDQESQHELRTSRIALRPQPRVGAD